jgi:hypothetical protein
MKITHRRKWLLYTGFFTIIYGFFIVLALMMPLLWLNLILVLLFGSSILIPFYFRHHYRIQIRRKSSGWFLKTNQQPLFTADGTPQPTSILATRISLCLSFTRQSLGGNLTIELKLNQSFYMVVFIDR